MNTVREIQRINDQELERGIAGTSASWHAQYAKSAWVFVGNLDHGLSEGDLICVMSQYGEIEDLHLVREEETGKSRGFAFCKYEDARSCVLAVDNFIGIQLCDRTIRVDHVENYRLPKNLQEKAPDEGDNLTGPGQAYKDAELANKFSLQTGQDLFAPVKDSDDDEGSSNAEDVKKKEAKRKRKEERQQKREEKERRRQEKEQRKMRKEEKRRKKRSRKSDGRRGDDDSDETERDRHSSSKKRRRHDDDSLSGSSN